MYIRVNTMRPLGRCPYFFAFVVSPFARISHLHPHSLVARYMTRVMCIRARLVEEVIEYLVHTLGARAPQAPQRRARPDSVVHQPRGLSGISSTPIANGMCFPLHRRRATLQFPGSTALFLEQQSASL